MSFQEVPPLLQPGPDSRSGPAVGSLPDGDDPRRPDELATAPTLLDVELNTGSQLGQGDGDTAVSRAEDGGGRGHLS